MHNVFGNESADKLRVQLSDGRIMPLEDALIDYERLLNEESSKKEATSDTKDDKEVAKALKVGEWFRIDRNVIDKNKHIIYRKCIEAGTAGKRLWWRLEDSNRIANQNPNQYHRIMEVYIFKHDWVYKTEQEMRDMCEQVGDGMCDEIICDFELQMRILNGEVVNNLAQKADKLPCMRVIKLRNGETGFFGGGADYNFDSQPALLLKYNFNPNSKNYKCVPYAFRSVLS